MKDKLIVNIIHRPELSPEYAEKALGKGEGVRDESLDIFRFQQDCAHKYGLKTTIQITYASLFSDVIIDLAKKEHEQYGDEIGLSLLGLPCPEFKAKYKTEDFCIWMFDEARKAEIVDDVFGKFYEKFGFYPGSTSSYFLDAFTINYIKEHYPTVKCAVATCWEEGPRPTTPATIPGTPLWTAAPGILGSPLRSIPTAPPRMRRTIAASWPFPICPAI